MTTILRTRRRPYSSARDTRVVDHSPVLVNSIPDADTTETLPKINEHSEYIRALRNVFHSRFSDTKKQDTEKEEPYNHIHVMRKIMENPENRVLETADESLPHIQKHGTRK